MRIEALQLWRRLSAPGRFLLVAPLIAIVAILATSAAGLLGPPPQTSFASAAPTETGPAPPSSALEAPPTELPPSPSPMPPGSDPLLGSDGRFTILLLGSDYRGSSPGNRTDTMMLVSVAPSDGAVSVVSIPRDTARFRLPDGKIWATKLNSLYPSLVRRYGRDAAGTEMGREIGGTLGVEVDAYALIGMVGLTTLIDQIGGVDVVLDAPVQDPQYWTNEGVQGIYFPAGRNHLDGERALIFARTRKGDSDFQRVRRQQQLVQAVAEKLLDRGVDALPALLTLVRKWVITDVSIDKAAAIYELVSTADLEHVHSDVLGPRYADPIPGTVDYELRLDKVRALIARWFAPIAGSPAALGSQSPSQAP